MEYTGNDLYCDVIMKGEIPLKKEFESENVLAYHHTRPYCPVHIVVVPKKHIASFTALTKDDEPLLLEIVEVLKIMASKVEKEHGAARILTNLGTYQDNKHLHFHVVSGDPLPNRASH
ncbi:MAG TPA: HIT domain-containing protein [Candidatus Paceibacterota bacterium]|nr:HIT domain-containing protein [Candidatus Paceibacterota bacterium]